MKSKWIEEQKYISNSINNNSRSVCSFVQPPRIWINNLLNQQMFDSFQCLSFWLQLYL